MDENNIPQWLHDPATPLSDVISVIIHELRTPITCMRGGAELLIQVSRGKTCLKTLADLQGEIILVAEQVNRLLMLRTMTRELGAQPLAAQSVEADISPAQSMPAIEALLFDAIHMMQTASAAIKTDIAQFTKHCSKQLDTEEQTILDIMERGADAFCERVTVLLENGLHQRLQQEHGAAACDAIEPG